MQESRPYLKFNFTAYTTSPYPLGPFLKHGNGMDWFWSYFYTFLPCNQQFCPPKRRASWFVWKCENDNEDDMDKNGLPREENDYVKLNICVQINELKMQKFWTDSLDDPVVYKNVFCWNCIESPELKKIFDIWLTYWAEQWLFEHIYSCKLVNKHLDYVGLDSN